MKEHFSCVDGRTSLALIASDCSYNFAIDFLLRKGAEIERCSHDYDKDWTVIVTPKRAFFYDENRGVLLGE